MGSSNILNKFLGVAVTLLLLTLPILTSAADDEISQIDEIKLLIKNNNLQKALSLTENLLQKNPGDPAVRFIKATILEKTGDKDEAIVIYKNLTSSNNDQPEAFNNLAIIYAQSGDFKSAITTLESAFENHPGYATVYANLKQIYDKLASDAYKIALNLDSPPIELQLTALDQITDFSSDSGQILTTKSEPIASIQNDTVQSALEAASSTQKILEPIAESNPPPLDIIENLSAAGEEQIEKTTNNKTTEQQPDLPTASDALEIDRIKERVKGWAKAWASQDLEQYLSHYAGLFDPGGDVSLNEWKNQRENSIVNRNFIIVDLNNLKIDIQGESASVSFIEYYRSDIHEGSRNKTLKLRRDNGTWFITHEII